MEYALRDKDFESECAAYLSLNPCSNGICSASMFESSIHQIYETS